MKVIGYIVASALGGFVLSVVTAITTAPLWGWFEERTGIESLGHSGPADWVYIFLWVLWTSVLLALGFRVARSLSPGTRTRT